MYKLVYFEMASERELRETTNFKVDFLRLANQLQTCPPPSIDYPRAYISNNDIILEEIKKYFIKQLEPHPHRPNRRVILNLQETLEKWLHDRYEEKFRSHPQGKEKFIFEIMIEIQSKHWCKHHIISIDKFGCIQRRVGGGGCLFNNIECLV